MSKVQQLIAKALSTNSEEEAFTCLRMARKQSDKTFTVAEPKQPTPQNTFREIHLEQQLTVLNRMYKDAHTRAGYFMDEMTKAKIEKNKLASQVRSLNETVSLYKFALAIAAIAAIAAVVLAILI